MGLGLAIIGLIWLWDARDVTSCKPFLPSPVLKMVCTSALSRELFVLAAEFWSNFSSSYILCGTRLFWRWANASGRILRSFYGSAFCPCDRPTHHHFGRSTDGSGGVSRTEGGATTEARGRGERGLINAIGKAKAADSTQAHPPYSNPSP